MKRIYIIAFIFFVFSSFCFAQKERNLRLEQNILIEKIAEGKTNFILYTEQHGKAQRFVSFIEQEVRMDTEFIYVTQRHFNSNGSVDKDSSIVTRDNLRPIYYFAKIKNGTFIEEYEFFDRRIEGRLGNPENPENYIQEYKQESIYNAVVQDLNLRSFSFKDRSLLSITIYNPGKSFMDVTYKVIGREILEFSSVKIDAIKVEMEGALLPTTIWISERKQELLQQRTSLPNGSFFWKKKVL